MDDEKFVWEYGDQLCIWYGFDVQQTIPYGTPEDVRREVRRVMQVFRRSNRRFLMTTGNASTKDWPVASLEALFDESLQSGTFCQSL